MLSGKCDSPLLPHLVLCVLKIRQWGWPKERDPFYDIRELWEPTFQESLVSYMIVGWPFFLPLAHLWDTWQLLPTMLYFWSRTIPSSENLPVFYIAVPPALWFHRNLAKPAGRSISVWLSGAYEFRLLQLKSGMALHCPTPYPSLLSMSLLSRHQQDSNLFFGVLWCSRLAFPSVLPLA